MKKNYHIEEKEFLDTKDKVLQIEILIQNNKFNIYYKKGLLETLQIADDTFNSLVSNLENIVSPLSMEGVVPLVSVYVINTYTKINDNKKVEIEQQLKAHSNKIFGQDICRKLNYTILKDIFLKMGEEEDAIDSSLSLLYRDEKIVIE